MGVNLPEPPPFNAAALEALDIWGLMGNRLRLEALPAILDVLPVPDPPALIELLLIIAHAVQTKRAARI